MANRRPRVLRPTTLHDPTGEISANFEKCRTFKHAWDDFFPLDWEPPISGWRLSLRCIRCTTERYDTLTIHGGLISRRYVWPDGYILDRGRERPTIDEYRAAMFKRLRAQLSASRQIGDLTVDDSEHADIVPINRTNSTNTREARNGSDGNTGPRTTAAKRESPKRAGGKGAEERSKAVPASAARDDHPVNGRKVARVREHK